MAVPLTVYSFAPRLGNASFYYRIVSPLETARDLGLPVRALIDTDSVNIDVESRVRAFCESDVVLLYQPVGEASLQNARSAKSFIPSLRDGDWKYPPSLVIDTDDNLFNVNPHNGAFRNLGIRDPEGNDIPPGSVIGDVKDGQREVLWHDGECDDKCGNCGKNMDIATNRHRIETYRQMIDLSDAVTCSTPYVADCVKGDTVPRRVEVFPNLVRMDHYPQIDLAPSRNINILWQGGQNHYEDWFPLRQAMGDITRAYPEVHWIIWGAMYHWATDLIPPDRYTYHSWCHYHEYKLRRVMMDDDISLAPLADNRFNRCRSAIKFYEASVMKKPAATLAQNTGPYKSEIIPGKTGYLFDGPKDFVEKLSLLIEDQKERCQIASNAKDWVSQERDAMKHVPKRVAFWESLRTEVKRDHPHMPLDQWTKFVAEVEAQQKAQENGKPTPEAELQTA